VTEPYLKLLDRTRASVLAEGARAVMSGEKSVFDECRTRRRSWPAAPVLLGKGIARGGTGPKIRALTKIRPLANSPSRRVRKSTPCSDPAFTSRNGFSSRRRAYCCPRFVFVAATTQCPCVPCTFTARARRRRRAEWSIEKLVRDGPVVMAVDLPDTGEIETRQNAFLAYLLDRPLVEYGRRAHCNGARYLAQY